MGLLTGEDCGAVAADVKFATSAFENGRRSRALPLLILPWRIGPTTAAVCFVFLKVRASISINALRIAEWMHEACGEFYVFAAQDHCAALKYFSGAVLGGDVCGEHFPNQYMQLKTILLGPSENINEAVS